MKIDIVMAVYNGERFLKEQLDSIFNQTYKNFRLIIVDDNSNDNSRAIIEEYLKKYKNIVYLKNSKNLGVVKTFERGLNYSSAEFIALCDQDDVWEKEKLEIQLNKIKKYKVPALIHSDLSMIDERGDLFYKSYFEYRGYCLPDNKALNKIISQNGVMGNTVLINKKLKSLVLPFPENLAVHDYWIALVNEVFGKRITLKDKLVKYRIHSKNACNNKQNLSKKIKFSKKLPYRDINREKVLEEFLKRFNISKNDKKIIESFLNYLYLEGNAFKIFNSLIKYNFIKKGFFYRTKILLKLLLQ